jgi:hypothetical protein
MVTPHRQKPTMINIKKLAEQYGLAIAAEKLILV